MEEESPWLHKKTILVIAVGAMVSIFICFLFFFFFRPINTLTPDPNAGKQRTQLHLQTDGAIYVDLSGAVKNPGLYHVFLPARVADVLKQAGGLREDADLKYISEKLDLAKKVKDEEKIYIPFQGQSLVGFTQDDNAASGMDLLSVNTSSASQLQDLPGISRKKALLIVNNRPYLSLKDFQQKNKLSAGAYQKIENLISL